MKALSYPVKMPPWWRYLSIQGCGGADELALTT